MIVTFIGVSSCVPDVGEETACFVINDKHLVDTGWNGVLNMKKYGFDPLKLRSVILTHLHQDHYIGLAQLLFYLGLRGYSRLNVEPFKIYGPKGNLEKVVNSAFSFLQIERFPELMFDYMLFPINAGDDFEIDGLHFYTHSANHVSGINIPEEALCYKVIEGNTNATLAFTGDTSYYPPIAEFFKGAQLLIHDSAHTSAINSAKIANMAKVNKLLLIHYLKSDVEKSIDSAKEIFPYTYLAIEGDSIEIK